MFKLNKRFSVLFLCLAVLGFAFLSLGGEFLHEHVHDHGHDHEEEKECPLYQFLVQALIAFVVTITTTKIKVAYQRSVSYQFIISRAHYALASPRAPPSFA